MIYFCGGILRPEEGVAAGHQEGGWAVVLRWRRAVQQLLYYTLERGYRRVKTRIYIRTCIDKFKRLPGVIVK